MAKITPKRKLKRQPPPRERGGVNPLLVALGAGAGVAAGRKASGSIAARSVSNRAARLTKADLEMNGAYSSSDEIAKRSAGMVADYEYARMPRANDAKLSNYRGIAANNPMGPGKYDDAARTSGISAKDRNKYLEKSGAKLRIADAKRQRNGGAGQLLDEAAYLRANRKRTRTGVKGGVAGGALATLAQLVAMELSKKK
jgi:hypothetical protein